jgi:hypothetical protein
MSCTIENGYSIPCRDLGGLKDLWITTWNSNESKDAIAYDIKGVIDKLPPSTYHLFCLMLESASYQETLEANTENGTTYWRQTLSVVFYKINQDLLNMIQTLVQGRFRIIFQDQNGEYRLFGLENPVRTIEASIQTGKMFNELNGATVTFSTLSERPAATIGKQLAEETLYPEVLQFRLILDPRNEFDLGPLTTPGGNYELIVQEGIDFFSYYGTAGENFPDGNVVASQTKANLDLYPLDPSPVYTTSLLDETGPVFFQENLQFQSATELMFVYTNDPRAGSNPYRFKDSDVNAATNAPVGVLHPDGVVLSTLCAEIVINVIDARTNEVDIEIIRSHPPITEPSGYEGDLNFLTINMFDQSGNFTYTVDPLDPDRWTATLLPGTYNFSTKTKYRNTPSYPTSVAEIVFDIF